jgi:hypothetical protein
MPQVNDLAHFLQQPTPREQAVRSDAAVRRAAPLAAARVTPPPPRGVFDYLTRFGTLTLVLVLIALLVALAGCTAAHAQPSSWHSHRDGYLTRYQGIDGNGEPWTGTSYQSGFTTYFDASGPHGEQQHCRSWQQGWQTINECD